MQKKPRILKKLKAGPKLPDAQEPWYFVLKEWAFWEFFLGIVLILAVFFLGPKFSKWYGKKQEDKIWENGTIVDATLIRHGYLKGNYILLEYQWKNKTYQLKEFDGNWENLIEGAKMFVMVDTTSPEDVFLMGLNVENTDLENK